MNYYIADPHFGHANVIRFSDRPFADVDEMNRCLIENWNARVEVNGYVPVTLEELIANNARWREEDYS